MQFAILSLLAAVLVTLILLLVRRPEPDSAALSSRLGEKEQQIAIFSERLASKDAELARIRSERDGLRSDLNEAKRGLAEVAGRKAAEDEAQTLLRAEFPKIAADVLKANSEAFLGLAQG